jgi:acetoin utilization protein AcuC
MAEPIAVVYHRDALKYDFGPGHPFRADRFTKFMGLLEGLGVLADPRSELVEPDAATDADLLLVHTRDYLEGVRARAKVRSPLSGDTPLNSSIVEGALAVVGSSLKAAELIAEGKAKVAEAVGGGLHHAGRSYGGGFCVFNDVAVCAQALLDRFGFDRVLVFDTDVHAGNGTMDVFYGEPRVLFISVHQDPRTIYPGTGFVKQIGRGEGKGFTVNVPLPPGADDECMDLVLGKVFAPLVREFKPQTIIRNGGSDPHFSDGLGSLNLTLEGLRSIGEAVAEAASGVGCGVVDLCCSGYNPETVAQGWLALLSGVTGFEAPLQETTAPPRVSSSVLRETGAVIGEIRSKLADYWGFD